jgi:hypothetical protein
MKKLIVALAIAGALLAWGAPQVSAQGPYMKAAPSANPPAAPAKSDAKKKPKTTTLCTPPGGGTPKPC